LPGARALLRTPVVSYTFHHDPAPLFRAVGLFVSVARSDRLLHPEVSPAPCSMECGLSSTSPKRNRDRPTNLRQLHDTRKESERQRREFLTKAQ